ncbi:dienelactone hydrolase family protein [Pseudonocardia sp. ICBG1122]|nr:dienelactone hydrolase family protein [Pseudonocardia pini]
MNLNRYTQLPGGATAWVARPQGTPTRGVVLLPSMHGTTPVFEVMATGLATDHGWSVCVPEIITEDRDAPFDRRRLIVADIDDGAVFTILREAAAETAAATVSLIGFCVGGMYAMKASSLEVFDRLVAFYGMVRVPDYWHGPGQAEPMEYLRGNTDRVLAVFGEKDPFIPIADIDTVAAAGVTTLRYPEAGHAFAHGGGDHRPDDAADAWRHAVAFLKHA